MTKLSPSARVLWRWVGASGLPQLKPFALVSDKSLFPVCPTTSLKPKGSVLTAQAAHMNVSVTWPLSGGSSNSTYSLMYQTLEAFRQADVEAVVACLTEASIMRLLDASEALRYQIRVLFFQVGSAAGLFSPQTHQVTGYAGSWPTPLAAIT